MIRHEIKTIADSTAITLDPPNHIRSAYTLIVQNINTSGYIYIGAENVSLSSYGYKLYPGQGVTIELPSRSTMYAVSSDPGLQVAVMEIDRAI